MSHQNPKQSLLQSFIKLRKIDLTAAESVERNIRACYPKLSENEIEHMVIHNLNCNLETCTKSTASHSASRDDGQLR